jgi:phosphatidylserine synthase
MFETSRRIYVGTRKKHDQLWNVFVARPIAAALVALVAPTGVTPNQLTILNLFIFVAAAALMIALPTSAGALIAVGVLELSYLFDCADGMLARHKSLASKQGHLFDFFTDELKAVLLAGSLGVRLYRTGGFGLDLTRWASGDARFLLAGIGVVAVVASAISLTNFTRHPEISGQATTVAAHYEAASEAAKPRSLVGRLASHAMTFLRFLNHYPSHIWLFALVGALDVFFWMYGALNLLYLARGWLSLLLRFGRA